jgi:hydrogenase nickel incorporation protein HypA/HybF
MHELSLMEGMVADLEAEAAKQGFARICRIRLEVGRLSGVEVEALRFAFGPATEGSLAEGADLEILEIAGTGRCQACGAEVEIAARFDPCPACGDGFVQVSGGTELRIKDLDVE